MALSGKSCLVNLATASTRILKSMMADLQQDYIASVPKSKLKIVILICSLFDQAACPTDTDTSCSIGACS